MYGKNEILALTSFYDISENTYARVLFEMQLKHVFFMYDMLYSGKLRFTFTEKKTHTLYEKLYGEQ